MEMQLNKISLWLFLTKQAKEEKKRKKGKQLRDKKWYKQKKKRRKKERKKRQRKKKKKENGAIKNQIDLLQASCIVIHFLIFKKGLRKKETW